APAATADTTRTQPPGGLPPPVGDDRTASPHGGGPRLSAGRRHLAAARRPAGDARAAPRRCLARRLDERSHLHCSVWRQRDARRELRGGVDVVGFEEEEAAERLLRLRKRAVGRE